MSRLPRGEVAEADAALIRCDGEVRPRARVPLYLREPLPDVRQQLPLARAVRARLTGDGAAAQRPVGVEDVKFDRLLPLHCHAL
jgi:hypothetical protein